ncbi:MAG: hypothetical protein HY908_01185 [Myxococcales bacterium]|nr:hypothetical protein [Myxococcales bacterium]
MVHRITPLLPVLLAAVGLACDGGEPDRGAPRTSDRNVPTWEESTRQAIRAANHCATDDECVTLGDHCPFGCNITVHRDEASRIRALIAEHTASCINSCSFARETRCVAGSCAPSR